MFSGFASRSEEERYNRSVFKTLYFCQMRMVKLLQGTDADEIDGHEFERVLRNLVLKVRGMEGNKQGTLFSEGLKDVMELLGLGASKVTQGSSTMPPVR